MQPRALLLAAFAFAGGGSTSAATGPSLLPPAGYRSPQQVRAQLEAWARTYSSLARVVVFGESAGGRELALLEIAAKSKDAQTPGKRPAILVVANLEGSHLIGTEGALRLAEVILEKSSSDPAVSRLLSKHTVYVAPLLNPDAAQAAFVTPRVERLTNDQARDDDLDMLTDEDGPDDLDGDGLITTMRVREPGGSLVADRDDPRLLRPAEPGKGESGVFNVYSEGRDDDLDGKLNEDGIGGIEIARNFPHDFETASREAGLWPASQPETIALLEFVSAHPSVALVLGFSRENTLSNLQQTGRAEAPTDKVHVPERFAEVLGVQPDSELDLDDAVERIRAANFLPPSMDVTRDKVAQMMGAGPAVQLDKEDLPLIEAVSKEYKDALVAAKLDYPERRAMGVRRGSFFAWCYFQLGVPVFSADLWTFPDPPTKKDEEKGADKPTQKSPETPERSSDALFLAWSDTALGGAGFVPWKPFKHPTLGDVEIGGFVPLARTNPPSSDIAGTTSAHALFYLTLMQRLPELSLQATRVEALGDDTYRVSVHVGNTGWFPTATAQGRRAETAWPVTVRVSLGREQSLFSGLPQESISSIPGSGATRKLEWTVRGPKGSSFGVQASSPRAGSASTAVELR